MKLAEISIKRAIFATMMIAAMMVFGFFSLPRIGIELFPNVEFPVVTATVIYPGADPGTMESKVADPIEEALQSVAGIKRLTSRNLESVTQVIAEFELEVDANLALQDVRDKVASIERDLPDDIEPPVIQKFNVGAAPIMTVVLAGDVPLRDLTKIAKDTVKQEIQQVQGVGSVDIVGGRERQIKIFVDPARMAGFGLTVDDVIQAVRAQHLEMPAGYIKSGITELTVKTKGELKSAQEIGEILITGLGGASVRISDVADVIDDMEDARSASFLNGEPAVSLVIRKQSGGNAVRVADDVREALARMQPRLEKLGIKTAIPTDTSVFVERSIDDAAVDLLFGAGLTVLIILLFLHDLRSTLIAALAIPTSIVSTFAFIQVMGFTFNNITMLALSLAVGILVDDAIVVIENIFRHLEMGKGRRQAALDATSEIGFAVIATTLSIVAVFVPVAYMQGIIGRFFFQFGLTVSAAVLISMFVSFTLTPMLASRILQSTHQKQEGFFARSFNRAFSKLEAIYERILRWALHYRKTTILIAILSSVSSVFLIARVPGEFIPPEDRSEFAVNIELPTGTGLTATTQTAESIAADLRTHLPAIRDTFTTIGAGAEAQVNRARVQITLKPSRERDFSQQEAMRWVRERLQHLDGALITVVEIDAVGGDSGFRVQPIQFSIRGSDLDQVVQAAEALKAELAKDGRFVDLDTTYRGGKPEIAVDVDRNKAADLGVPVASIANTVRALIADDAIADIKEGADVYDVILQMPEEKRSDFETLSSIKLRSTTGRLIDLASVVHLHRDQGPSEIERQNRLRQVVVLSNLEGIAEGDAQKIVEEAAARVVPAELTTSWLGNVEMMQESFLYMLIALGLAIILVYMILAAQFDSLIQPITIMVSLPLSLVGAFGGLYLTGMTLSIFSFIGMIMLMGLVTKTAILLVDFANHERSQGTDIVEALVKAGRIRIRPILMTSAATIFGMVPVALALSEGGSTRAPMAVCVIGGMITSTALTLVVIPVVYLLFYRLTTHRWLKWLSQKLFSAAE